MSYHIYQTEGFVLSSVPRGEADRQYTLYTEGMGLVSAKAQGVRLLKSKLRYALDDYHHASFSLVRGKEFWRITNVKKSDDVCVLSGEVLKVRGRIFSLLRRLLHGEEKNEYLYTTMKSGFVFLTNGKFDNHGQRAIETLIVFKILYALGYINGEDLFSPFLKSAIINSDNIKNFTPHYRDALKAINEALKESQL